MCSILTLLHHGILTASLNLTWDTSLCADQSGWKGKRWLSSRVATKTTSTGPSTFFVAQEAGYKVEDFDYFIVNSVNQTFQIPSLKGLGIPKDKIVALDQLGPLELETLVVPSAADQSGLIHNSVVSKLAKNLAGTPQAGSEPHQKLLISRDPKFGRTFENYQELRTLLKGHGFIEVFLEHSSLQDQIDLFRSAKVIVSAHGAALTNLTYCEAGTSVHEILDRDFAHQVYYMIAMAKGLDYTCQMASPNAPDLKTESHARSLEVDLRQIESFLVETESPSTT